MATVAASYLRIRSFFYHVLQMKLVLSWQIKLRMILEFVQHLRRPAK